MESFYCHCGPGLLRTHYCYSMQIHLSYKVNMYFYYGWDDYITFLNVDSHLPYQNQFFNVLVLHRCISTIVQINKEKA